MSMNQISSEQWKQMGRDSFDARLLAIIRRNHPDQAARMDFAARSARSTARPPRRRAMA